MGQAAHVRPTGARPTDQTLSCIVADMTPANGQYAEPLRRKLDELRAESKTRDDVQR